MSTVHEVPDSVQLTPPEFDAFLALLDDDDAPPPDWPDMPPRPPEPALPFAAWVEAQASYYRSLNTRAGDWLAGRIEADAATARLVRAGNPDDFNDREDELIESHHAQLRADGYERACEEFGPIRF